MHSLELSLGILGSPPFSQYVGDHLLARLCLLDRDLVPDFIQSLDGIFLEEREGWMILRQLLEFNLEASLLPFDKLNVLVLESRGIVHDLELNQPRFQIVLEVHVLDIQILQLGVLIVQKHLRIVVLVDVVIGFDSDSLVLSFPAYRSLGGSLQLVPDVTGQLFVAEIFGQSPIVGTLAVEQIENQSLESRLDVRNCLSNLIFTGFNVLFELDHKLPFEHGVLQVETLDTFEQRGL